MGDSTRTGGLVLGLAALLLTAAIHPARAQAPSPAGLDPAERVYGLSLIWREATYTFPYFDLQPDLDWDAAYRDAVPRVLAASTTLDYYRELQRFAALLRDGHTRVELPDSITGRNPFSSPWVEVKAVGDRALVANVAADLADSLPIGSEIVEVDGLSVRERLERDALPYVFATAPRSRTISAIEGSLTRGYGLLVGPPGTVVRVAAVTPSGERVTVGLLRDRFDGPRAWARPAEDRRDDLLELDWPGPGIARLLVRSFADPAVVTRLDSLLPTLREARGVVLDLRRNGGGSDLIAVEVLARFAEGPYVATGSRVRVNDAYRRALGSFGRELLERVLPAEESELIDSSVEHFEGRAWRIEPPDTLDSDWDGDRIDAPVAILTGRGTASAAEDFVVMIPDEPRLFTVGQATAASTGQPLVFALPGGGSGQVVTRAALLSDGTPVVLRGVEPDVLVEPTIEDVREGRDPTLARAVAELEARAGRLGARAGGD